MSMPRRIIPGTTYLLTRRCSRREFRLWPGGKVPLVFAYVLAVVAERYGVEVHLALLMDNHYHLLVTDPRGDLPKFTRDLNSITARATNSLEGRWEAVWNSSRMSQVELVGAEDIWRKLVYVLANPAAADLVDSLSHWPGFVTRLVDHERAPRVFKRPKIPFFARSKMPASGTLHLTIPRVFGEMTPGAFTRELRERLARREAELRAARRAEGRRVMGASRLRRPPRTSGPTTEAPRRQRDPAIAAKDTSQRVAALAALRHFRDLYRRALEAWRKASGPVVFPFGTYKLRDYPGVAIAAPPPNLVAA